MYPLCLKLWIEARCNANSMYTFVKPKPAFTSIVKYWDTDAMNCVHFLTVTLYECVAFILFIF